MVEAGRTHPSQEIEPHRGAKQPRGMQTRSANEGEKRGDHRAAAPAWAPHMELDGTALPSDASIQDFQQAMVEYVTDAVEQSLLLPKDMIDLRSMRQHKVFLSLKRDLAMVSLFSSLLSTFFFFFLIVLLFLFKPSKLCLGPRRW